MGYEVMKTMNSLSKKVLTLPEEELEAALALSADDDELFMTSDVSTIGFNVCKYFVKSFVKFIFIKC